jgi:hypothetical protein
MYKNQFKMYQRYERLKTTDEMDEENGISTQWSIIQQ